MCHRSGVSATSPSSNLWRRAKAALGYRENWSPGIKAKRNRTRGTVGVCINSQSIKDEMIATLSHIGLEYFCLVALKNNEDNFSITYLRCQFSGVLVDLCDPCPES